MEIWETIEARGLDVERLSQKWSVSSLAGGEALQIPFVQQGKTVGTKFRWFTHPERKWHASWDNGPVAYNADCLRDDKLIGRPLIITEGEIDCESVIEAGYQRVISVPNGCAGASTERSEAELGEAKAYDWLRALGPFLTLSRVSEIILAVDGDDAGAKLLQELASQLGRARCKFVQYPKTRRLELERERCKDLNEVLVEYGVKGVQKTLAGSEWIAMRGVALMGDLPPISNPETFEIGFNLLGDNYRMRCGDLAVITGTPGSGKSTWLNDVCCRVADKYKVRVAWASFEQLPQRDHRRALRSWYLKALPRNQTPMEISQADEWIDDRHVFIIPDEEVDADLEWLLDCMEAAVVRYEAKIICLDPWNEIVQSRGSRETETDYTSRALRQLKRFAKRFQVHVILVAHPTKMQRINGEYQKPTLYDIAGSANFANKTDVGIVVHKVDQDTSLVEVLKSRYWEEIGRPGGVLMEYCNDDRRFRESERSV